MTSNDVDPMWDDMAADHAAGRHVSETARRGHAGDLEGCLRCMDDELATEEQAARVLALVRRNGVGYLDHFAARVIQDALAEADAAYCERRAIALEDARHRFGDFAGQATQSQLKERHRMLTDLANSYRARARGAQR